jgi:glucose-1-phosphate adenylyltransferase
VKNGKAMAHKFADSCVTSGLEDEPYWRDVGTIDAFWQANIDLTDFVPKLDIYDNSLADLDLFRNRAAGQVHP